jgi:pimeloyl-ACP methyl ester carboxylesterase
MDISEFTARRRTLTTASGDIAYTESGAGPAAVFVHGLATSGALWRHVIERVDRTTRCIAVDLPLHGGTARPDPGARVVEIDGGKLFFPEERPEKLAVQLRRHWAR